MGTVKPRPRHQEGKDQLSIIGSGPDGSAPDDLLDWRTELNKMQLREKFDLLFSFFLLPEAEGDDEIVLSNTLDLLTKCYWNGPLTLDTARAFGDELSCPPCGQSETWGNRGLAALPTPKGLKLFSNTSGLQPNSRKSAINCSGMDEKEIKRVVDISGFSRNEIPFKYLGIPICAKRISSAECRLLVENMTARIKIWGTRNLSYAGRLKTREKLYRFNIAEEPNCIFCNGPEETVSHVFLNALYLKSVLTRLKAGLDGKLQQ
uniref:Reverse transcriptase zinc-binding domain-containing protein n=1 Tax=Cannabis sativa TaxID=3483 RepID=A0A803NMR6_CANSA